MSDIATAIQAGSATLAAAQRIVTAGHVRPDGDALGSSVALTIAARRAGKEAFATFAEPFVIPAAYAHLDTEWLVPPDTAFGDIDLFVALDTAVPERLGSVGVLAERAGSVLVVDHHASNVGFGDVEVIDPGAAATAQLVYELIVALDWELSEQVAAAIYTGLVTDTGRFQYSSTSPRVHHIAAALLEAGVRPDEIGQQVYEQSRFAYLGVAGSVLSRAVLDPQRSLVWSVLFRSDLETAGIDDEDVDSLIDLVRVAREAQVACLLKETPDGLIKGSLRSRGLVDVAAIAQTLGGGGHHNAAGFTFAGTPDEAIGRVRSRL